MTRVRLTREVARGAALGFLNAIVPKLRGKVVVHSRPDFEDGALAVLEELGKRGRYPIVLTEARRRPDDLRRYAPGLTLKSSPPLVHKNSLRGRYHFLTAETIITTHQPFTSHRPPSRQRILNIWHGEALGKPVGLLVENQPPLATWATSLSAIGRAFRALEFGLPPGRVVVAGAPRNDRLLRAPRDRVRRAIIGSGSPTVSAWLPTYRQGSDNRRVDGTPYSGILPLTDPELGELDAWLEAHDHVLLAKPHPVVPVPPVGTYRQIKVIDGEWLAARALTLYTFLTGLDCLITDVSSVWIDFLLVDKPLVFAFPDLAAYRQTRGFNLEPYEAWLPGPLVTDGASLIGALERLSDDSHGELRRCARRRFHRYDDDASTARSLDAIGL